MARTLLESLSGIGHVYVGDLLLRETTYQLSRWSDDERRGNGHDAAAAESIDGHIDITGIGEAVVLAGPGTLALELEDGRRMAFRLTNTGGAIVGKGALEPARD